MTKGCRVQMHIQSFNQNNWNFWRSWDGSLQVHIQFARVPIANWRCDEFPGLNNTLSHRYLNWSRGLFIIRVWSNGGATPGTFQDLCNSGILHTS